MTTIRVTLFGIPVVTIEVTHDPTQITFDLVEDDTEMLQPLSEASYDPEEAHIIWCAAGKDEDE